MTVYPDLEALFDKHGVVLIGLEFFGLDGLEPNLEQVLNFLSARKVIAGVSAGSTYGSTAAVVANICAMQDDDSIAVALPDGRLGRGQEAIAFFEAAAYALNCQLVIDEYDVLIPNAEIAPYPDEGSVFGAVQSLSFVRAKTPATAVSALLSMPATGRYGVVGEHLMIAPQEGFLLTPHTLADRPRALPLITFERSGDLRTVMLGCTAKMDYTLVVSCGPRFEQATPTPAGTPARQLSDGVSQIPLVMTDDEQLGQASKSRGRKWLPRKFVGHELVELLSEQAADLAGSNPDQFFVAVAQALRLGPGIEQVLDAFEATPTPLKSPALAGYPLTMVSGHEPGSWAALATTTVVETLLRKYPDGDLTTMNAVQRSRWSPVVLVVFCVLLGLGALFCLVSVFTGWFGTIIGTVSDGKFLAGALALLLSVGLFGQLLALAGITPARGLIAQARADGVLK